MFFTDYQTIPWVIQQEQTAFMKIDCTDYTRKAINSTHIKIIAASVDKNVNRKSQHCINTQLVFDANNCILDMVPK